MAFRRSRHARRALAFTAITGLGVIFAFAGQTGPARAAAGQPVDVLFVFDTTGSMGGALAQAKTQVTDAITSVRAGYPDSEFALGTVADYDPGDTPWALKQPLTSDPSLVQAALDPLTATGGGDTPEAYGRALYEAANNTGIGWRSGAKHILILVNDDVPHDNDLNEGVPADIQTQPSPWNTGVDAGPDGVVGTADDIDWQAQLASLKTRGIVFATVFYSGASAYLPYWDWWTKQTGGSTSVGGSTTSLGDILAKLIDASVSGSGGSDPLNPADWSPGDVHVHSLGDASLRDNLDCRHNVPGFPASHAATRDQERACATYLVNKVLTTAKSHGLKWVILSEHGVWMGIYAPGADLSARNYSRSEATWEWQTVRDTASAAAPTAGVRALIGEEIGSAPPLTTSGHFSTYYSPDYVPNDQYDNSEGKFLQKVKAAGAWGAINHPGTGSTWGCWYTTDQKPIYHRGTRVGTTCPDGVASSFPDQVRAIEVYTSDVKPIANVLTRWDGLLDRGLKVAAVGGGDTHTVQRCGLGTSGCSVRQILQQKIGNTSALGADGRARTYVLAGNVTPSSGYNSNDAADPVRAALASGKTLASDGPVAGVAIDGKAPASTSFLPYSDSGHTVQITWDPAQAKAVDSGGTSNGTYGSPTSVRLVIGQIVDNTYRGDCGHASDPFRHSDCVHTIDVPLNTIPSGGGLDKITYQLKASDFKTFTLAGPGTGFSTQYTPAAFVRVEIDFAGGHGVYSSPFYVQGTATQIPNF